jgi:hypothetical protein
MKVRYLLFGLVVMFVAGVLVSSSYAKIDPKTIAGLWLFDENKGDTAADSSGNKNDGTLKNGPKWVDGKFGKALDFDGVDDYVDCGVDASPNSITDAITIVAWVYPRLESNYEYIVSNDRDCCGQYKGYSLSLGYTGFQIWDTNSAAHMVNLASKPSLKSWCHLAGTFDGKLLNIYLDGKLSKSTAFAGKIGTPSSYALAIGGLGMNPGAYRINGIIDEVAIFNVALAEGDIQTIMNKGLKESSSFAVDLSGKLASTWASIKR